MQKFIGSKIFLINDLKQKKSFDVNFVYIKVNSVMIHTPIENNNVLKMDTIYDSPRFYTQDESESQP